MVMPRRSSRDVSLLRFWDWCHGKPTGEVFNLKQLLDINGDYIAASAGAALWGGETETTTKNQNGVVIEVRATTARVDLRLSIDGASIKVL